MTLDLLPLDMLQQIIGDDMEVYYGLICAYKRFADSNGWNKFDYMVRFGFDVRVRSMLIRYYKSKGEIEFRRETYIIWLRNGLPQCAGYPTVQTECCDDYYIWTNKRGFSYLHRSDNLLSHIGNCRKLQLILYHNMSCQPFRLPSCMNCSRVRGIIVDKCCVSRYVNGACQSIVSGIKKIDGIPPKWCR